MKLKAIFAGLAVTVLILLIVPLRSQVPSVPADVATALANGALFFEAPRPLSDSNLRFVQTLDVKGRLVILYESILNPSLTGGKIDIVGRENDSEGQWGDAFTVVSGLAYEGAQAPLIYSAVSDSNGRIIVAYSKDAQSIGVMSSGSPMQGVYRFSETATITYESTVVSPRLAKTSSGGFAIVVTRGTGQSQNLMIASSSDGIGWTPFSQLDSDLQGNINSNPSFAYLGKRDFVVFQSANLALATSNAGTSYQIYIKSSDDGGRTWSASWLLSDFVNPADNVGPEAAGSYDNERPILVQDSKGFSMYWERAYRRAVRQIWTMGLDQSGKVLRKAEQVSDNNAGATAPSYQQMNGRDYLAWFTPGARGSRVFLSTRGADGWESREMSPGVTGSSLYPTMGTIGGRLHMLYHVRSDSGNGATQDLPTRVYYVEPVEHARPPRIEAVNFTPSSRSNHKDLSIRLLPPSQPDDPAGIVAFNYTFSRDASQTVPALARFGLNASLPDIHLEGDGTWYIRARNLNRAGVWSDAATLSYTLDTTPPDPVTFQPLPLDEKGYLRSNTFTVSWKPAPPNDTASYAWSLQFLGDIPPSQVNAQNIDADALPVMGTETQNSLSRTNVENGVYLLVTWPLDSVGNRGKARTAFLYADKYIPSTLISSISVSRDILGASYMSISGRGFTANGVISRVVLSKTGTAPYDYEFTLSKAEYQLSSDRLIDNLKIDNIKTGSYLVGLDHTERGLEFGSRRVEFQEHGVIKFGDFNIGTPENFKSVTTAPFRIEGGTLLIYLVMLLLALVVLVSTFQLRAVYREAILMRRTAVALIDGTMSPEWESQRKAKSMKRQRFGLRLKFTISFISLVLAIVLMISLPLSNFTLSNQKAVLAQGLQERLNVLTDSLQSSATFFLQNSDNYSVEIGQLPDQGKNMAEVVYVDITAQGRDKSPNFDTLWASNDPFMTNTTQALQALVVTPEDRKIPILKRERLPFKDSQGNEVTEFLAGRSGIQDSLSDLIPKYRDDFDSKARKALGTIPAELDSNANEIKSMALNTTAQGAQDMSRLDDVRRELSAELATRLRSLGGKIMSIPSYDPSAYDTNITHYIFYKPIYYRVTGESPETANYYRGMLRVGVNTVPINEQIATTQKTIITTIVLFALLAMGIGVLASIGLSSLIVVPIRRLVRGVEEIKGIITQEVNAQVQQFDTYIKKDDLTLKSQDELATLGGTINEMVHGLHKAAVANQDLYAGKDIQKMFIPLNKLKDGSKGTTGDVLTDSLDVFGYYEGAKGVSGDYFNYQKLSNDTFAFIKCDVAGKGIPAALIMVEVATLFLNYFEGWEERRIRERRIAIAQGNKSNDEEVLVPLVRSINDLIAEREFRERFAALTIVLLNQKTGEATFCNAGDNQLYVYRKAQRKIQRITLSIQPAAGRFSSKEYPIVFKEDKYHLESGDIMMMFTDGVEEAQRRFRGPDWSLTPITESDKAAGLVAEEVGVGSEFEELGMERITGIIEAVQRHGTFVLTKVKNPIPDEELVFDFTTLKGTAEDTVLALVAVEKVFRLLPDQSAGELDFIAVDRKVDAFLQQHFVQFKSYFRYLRPDSTNEVYVEYTHLREESQYDDLTVLAVKKL